MLASLVWKPRWRRVAGLIGFEIAAIVALIASAPRMTERYVNHFVYNLPVQKAASIFRP